MGKFGDHLYVKDAEIRFGNQEEFQASAKAGIAKAKTEKELASCEARCKTLFANETISGDAYRELLQAVEVRRKELA